MSFSPYPFLLSGSLYQEEDIPPLHFSISTGTSAGSSLTLRLSARLPLRLPHDSSLLTVILCLLPIGVYHFPTPPLVPLCDGHCRVHGYSDIYNMPLHDRDRELLQTEVISLYYPSPLSHDFYAGNSSSLNHSTHYATNAC